MSGSKTKAELYKLATAKRKKECPPITKMSRRQLEQYVSGTKTIKIKKVKPKPKTIKIKKVKPKPKTVKIKKVKPKPDFKDLIKIKENIEVLKSKKTQIKRKFKGREKDLSTQGDFRRLYNKLFVHFKPIIDTYRGVEIINKKGIDITHREIGNVKRRITAVGKNKKFIYAKFYNKTTGGEFDDVHMEKFQYANLEKLLKKTKMNLETLIGNLKKSREAIKNVMDADRGTETILDYDNYLKAEGMFDLLGDFLEFITGREY